MADHESVAVKGGKIKNGCLWGSAALFALTAICVFPHISGFIAFFAAALILPIPRWQKWMDRIIKKEQKIFVAAVLAFLTFVMLPSSETLEASEVFPEVIIASSETGNMANRAPASSSEPQRPSSEPAVSSSSAISDVLEAEIPVSSASSPADSAETSQNYILNTNTKKFHYLHCSSVNKMKEANKAEFSGAREDVIASGYEPCGRCDP